MSGNPTLNRLIHQTIYDLKHRFGAEVTVYKIVDSTTNYKTGAKSIDTTSRLVRKAIVLPSTLSREIFQSVSYLSASKSFASLGGQGWDETSRGFIFDGRDLIDYTWELEDWIVYRGKRYDLQTIESLEWDTGYLIVAKEVKGQVSGGGSIAEVSTITNFQQNVVPLVEDTTQVQEDSLVFNQTAIPILDIALVINQSLDLIDDPIGGLGISLAQSLVLVDDADFNLDFALNISQILGVVDDADGVAEANSFMATVHEASPFVAAFPWDRGAGTFGTKIADPATLPAGVSGGVEWTADNSHIMVAHETTPFISAYPWNGTFGTKLSDPGTLPTGNGFFLDISPDDAYVAVVHATAPRISVYPWTGSSFGTKISDPASPLNGTGIGVQFNYANDAIAIGTSLNPPATFIHAYPWSGSFGTKFSDPATIPDGGVFAVSFQPPSDSHLACSSTATPFIFAYPWSGSGFGTKVANPATLPTGGSTSVAFSRDGSHIASAFGSSPFVHIYPFTTGFGTKVGNPATLPASVSIGVNWDKDDDWVVVTEGNSPFLDMYPWTGSSFGTRVSPPSDIPSGGTQHAAFTN